MVLQLDGDQDPGRRRRTAGLVEQLARPAAKFLQPRLEELLHRYVAADDSVARDQIARVLAGACESAALPALLRALVEDRNEDAGLRRVGVWGLSALDWSQRDEYIELVVEAGSDVGSSVRSEAMSALGSVFGAGHPRAREAVMAAVRDVDPEVRRSAVEALRSWSDDETEALLLTCADDPDSWVRSQAARALAGIRRRERTPRHLLDALPHEP